MPNRKRDSEGRFASGGSFIDAMRDRPYAAAGVAAGVAAAGAFLWSKRSQIGDLASSGMDRLSELKSERMGGTKQSDIAEEALTLKETGRKSRGPRGPIAQQDIKSGMAVG
jgi:hypothetical protein